MVKFQIYIINWCGIKIYYIYEKYVIKNSIWDYKKEGKKNV